MFILDNACREFLVLLSRHYGLSESRNVQLLVTAAGPGTLHIHSPLNHTVINVTLATGNNTVDLPPELAAQPLKVERKGVYITSDVDVTLHVMQYLSVSDTGYLVLPLGSLSTFYVVPTYYAVPIRDPSQIMVGATENDTHVSFEISLRSRHKISYNGRNYGTGDIINITLNQYETFQLISEGDMTGTKVHSDKNVAILSGSMSSYIPFNSRGLDKQTVEQMIQPAKNLGKKYIVPPLMDRNNYNVRVISVYPDTSVYIGGSTVDLGKAGDYREGQFGTSPIEVSANKAILVVQYAHTQKTTQGRGSGAMIIVPDVTQFQTEYNFTLPDPPKRILQPGYIHYISIIVPGNNTGKVSIDGKDFTKYNSNVASVTTNEGGQFSVVSVEVGPGFHSVKSTIPFGMTANGRDYSQGYGYQLSARCH